MTASAPARLCGWLAGLLPENVQGKERSGQFKLFPQGPPLGPEFFMMSHGFRRAGIRQDGEQESRRAEEEGLRAFPDGAQGGAQSQVQHGGLVGMVAQRFRQAFKKGLLFSCVFGAFRMAAVLVPEPVGRCRLKEGFQKLRRHGG